MNVEPSADAPRVTIRLVQALAGCGTAARQMSRTQATATTCRCMVSPPGGAGAGRRRSGEDTSKGPDPCPSPDPALSPGSVGRGAAQDRALLADDEDVARRSAPHAEERPARVLLNLAPGDAVPVQERASHPRRPHVGAGGPPDACDVLPGAARHRG